MRGLMAAGGTAPCPGLSHPPLGSAAWSDVTLPAPPWALIPLPWAPHLPSLVKGRAKMNGRDGMMQDIPFPVGKSLGKRLPDSGQQDCRARESNSRCPARARPKVRGAGPSAAPSPRDFLATAEPRPISAGASLPMPGHGRAPTEHAPRWARPLPRGIVEGGGG